MRIRPADTRRQVDTICGYCGRMVTMLWNVEKDGYKAFCPHCGSKLMLCGQCYWDGDPEEECDYDETTDKCRHDR